MKTCRQCAMEIPDLARKCPHCQSWQTWREGLRRNPVVLFIGVWIAFCLIAAGVVQWAMGGVARSLALFEADPATLRQVETSNLRVVFGEDKQGPMVAALGTITNRGPKLLGTAVLHVEFKDANGAVIDVSERATRYSLPPGVPLAFKVAEHRLFPPTSYVSATVTVTAISRPL